MLGSSVSCPGRDRSALPYRAMVSRGFDGEIRVLDPTPAGWADAAFVVGWTVFFAAALTWNLADLLGRLFMGGLS